MKKILAIDLGGMSAKCAIIQDHKILNRFTIKTEIGRIIENLKEKTDLNLKDLNISWDEIDAISLSMPGVYNSQTGIVAFAGNLEWWNYEVRKIFEHQFENKKIYILNDANAAAYGEWKLGQKEIPDSMILFTIGTGVGTGLILDKKLWEGTRKRFAAEGGHGGAFYNETSLCSCGTYGCLELASSATGIEKLLNKKENKKLIEQKLNKQIDHIKIIDIADLFKAKDEFIINIFKKALLPLAKAIGYLNGVLDVNKIVIGGGPSNLGDGICEIIKEDMQKYSVKEFCGDLDIEIAKLNNDAGIWGAYFFAIDN